MTPDQILKANDKYKEFFKTTHYKPVPCADDDNYHPHGMSHLFWMTFQIPIFVKQNRADKAMRWLCFIQGALWTYGAYTIKEFKADNRPGS